MEGGSYFRIRAVPQRKAHCRPEVPQGYHMSGDKRPYSTKDIPLCEHVSSFIDDVSMRLVKLHPDRMR